MSELVKQCEKDMQARTEAFERDLQKTRTGRANIALLDRVRVDYYGAPTPLSQVASLSTPDATTILISPFEKSIIGEVERAIFKADLGVSPTNDGQVVRVAIPALTEERRKEIVKGLKKTAEEARISVRKIRRDVNDKLKKMEKDKEISEDENKKFQQDVQKITDRFVAKVDEKFNSKEKEILTF